VCKSTKEVEKGRVKWRKGARVRSLQEGREEVEHERRGAGREVPPRRRGCAEEEGCREGEGGEGKEGGG